MAHILKFPVPISDNYIRIPGEIVHFANQGGVMYAWSFVYDEEDYSLEYRVYGTGLPIEANDYHIMTAMQDPYVWHLFYRSV